MLSHISFLLDGRIVTIDPSSSSGVSPTTTLLTYLRNLPNHKGVKEGCAEGDCGACTVVLGELCSDGKMHYMAIDSCLVLLPMVHGKQVITVENLKDSDGTLHPVQQALIDAYGSQCGFCTPGITMTLFALYKSEIAPTQTEIEDAFVGNLCRCTGYRPIVSAAISATSLPNREDHFSRNEAATIALLQRIPKESLYFNTIQQTYHRPILLQEALDIRRQSPSVLVVNGGTDVALRITKKHELLEEILDVSAVRELKEVVSSHESLILGAGLSLNEVRLLVKEDYPALEEMLDVFGSKQIRNLGTLGGNLGSASPIGDTLPVLMAYGARVRVQNVDGSREILIDEFITGYRRTACRPDELIVAIILPRPVRSTSVRSFKVSKRRDLDISTVSGGFAVRLDDHNRVARCTLAFGGLADRTKRAHSVERQLQGKEWSRSVVEAAAELVKNDFAPITDARAGADFRLVAARNLILKFWMSTQ
jgi:xanthine dehydrogenase small subunit